MKYPLPLMNIPKFAHQYQYVQKALPFVKALDEVGSGVAQLKNGCGIKKGTLKFKM